MPKVKPETKKIKELEKELRQLNKVKDAFQFLVELYVIEKHSPGMLRMYEFELNPMKAVRKIIEHVEGVERQRTFMEGQYQSIRTASVQTETAFNKLMEGLLPAKEIQK